MEKLSSQNTQSWLSWFARGLLLLGALVLLGRLFELQVIKGGYFRALAEENRIRRVPITAARGRILTRGGEVLAGNLEIKRKIIFNPDNGYEKSDDITGANDNEIITEWLRSYPAGETAAHITGYLGQVEKGEVGKISPDCPEKGPRKQNTLVGRSGLEEQYECILSGIDGEELIEVDTMGRKIRTLGKREPVPGNDITVTIDYLLQKKVAEVMEDKQGAIVVSDPDGEILALYSSPSYDPNVFVKKRKQKEVENVLNDANLPLFNRAIGGLYHPGSVYKQVVAIAGLEEAEIDKDYTYEDTGQVTVDSPYGSFNYTNWYFTQYGGVEGKINLVRAIQRSTDTFFYKVGELLGVEKLVTWSENFSLNKKTGIDLPGEVAGLIPSPEWKLETKGERWFLGNTYHMSIGQGDIALTPLLVNNLTSTIASNGNLCQPRLLGNESCQELGIKKENIELVKEGMSAACSSGGTGYTFFDFKPKDVAEGNRVACKTGTAETNEEDVTHAWFTVYAPVDKPEIIATVLVEKGGEGSSVAGPIAREIFDYWFNTGVKPTPSPTPANER
jgi:penicillin-binding protein 2